MGTTAYSGKVVLEETGTVIEKLGLLVGCVCRLSTLKRVWLIILFPSSFILVSDLDYLAQLFRFLVAFLQKN